MSALTREECVDTIKTLVEECLQAARDMRSEARGLQESIEFDKPSVKTTDDPEPMSAYLKGFRKGKDILKMCS